MDPDDAAIAPIRPSAEAALNAWRTLLDRFSEQSSRLEEVSTAGTEAFWSARMPTFAPYASQSEELAYLLSLAHPADTWMDIGAGAGRLAVPLAAVAAHVIAVDTSPTMRASLTAAGVAATSLSVEAARWPEEADRLPEVDATLAANMLYTSSDPLAFIEAMERRSRRLCVVVLADRPPRTPDAAIWEAVYGEPLMVLPGAHEFIAVMSALGRRFNVAMFPSPAVAPAPLEEAVPREARRLGLRDDSPRIERLVQALRARRQPGAANLVQLAGGRRFTAVIHWTPPEHTPD